MNKLCRAITTKTDHRTSLILLTNGEIIYDPVPYEEIPNISSYLHLNIISLDDNEKINMGEWFYKESDNKIILNRLELTIDNPNIARKVIASTNPTFELPQPSPNYIRKFVEQHNNGNVEDILVEYQTDWNEETKMCMEGYGDNVQDFSFTPKPIIRNSKYILIKSYRQPEIKETKYYTENEVKELFERWLNLQIEEELMRLSEEVDPLYATCFYDWFEENKK